MVRLFLRAVPPPVWALLVLIVVFPAHSPAESPWRCTRSGYSLGSMRKRSKTPTRHLAAALRTAAAPTLPSMAYGGLPLVASRFFALSMYRCEVATRETVIVGLVGAGGLGRMLTQQNASFDEPAMLTTIITLIAVSLAIDLISARVRAAIR